MPQIVEPDFANARVLERRSEMPEELRAVDRSAGVRMREDEIFVGLVARGLEQQLELAGNVVRQRDTP